MPEEKLNSLEEAKEVLKQIKAENAKHEALIKREEELGVEKLLSGRSDAGIIQPPVDKEEEKKRINKWLEPTGRRI